MDEREKNDHTLFGVVLLVLVKDPVNGLCYGFYLFLPDTKHLVVVVVVVV